MDRTFWQKPSELLGSAWGGVVAPLKHVGRTHFSGVRRHPKVLDLIEGVQFGTPWSLDGFRWWFGLSLDRQVVASVFFDAMKA
jgi:hypothetical protein